MIFNDNYPKSPPNCKFRPAIFHPNVFPSGAVCASFLNDEEDWNPTITIKQVLLEIQNLLDKPNLMAPAHVEPFYMFLNNPEGYKEKIRQFIVSSLKNVHFVKDFEVIIDKFMKKKTFFYFRIFNVKMGNLMQIKRKSGQWPFKWSNQIQWSKLMHLQCSTRLKKKLGIPKLEHTQTQCENW